MRTHHFTNLYLMLQWDTEEDMNAFREHLDAFVEFTFKLSLGT